jgi:transcription initiation factor IIE alpha subunit
LGGRFERGGFDAASNVKVYCPHCDAPLEVIDENPVMLEELDE